MNKKVETEIRINTSAERVWEILSDFESFPEWNPFVIRVEGEPKEGEKLKIDVQIPGSMKTSFTPEVLKATPNEELRWAGSLPLNLFGGEHYYLIESIEDNKVRFIHGENLSGLLVRLIWFFRGEKILAGYKLMNEALKRRAESD